VERNDAAQLAAALSFALRSRKPTLIACRTPTGFTSPLPGAATAAGAPVGEVEAAVMKRSWGWHHAPFAVPEILAARWSGAGARGAAARRSWLKRVARHPMRAEFERVIAGRLSDTWHEAMAAMKASLAEERPAIATQQSSRQALAALVPALPELIGGSADPTTSELTLIKGMGTVAPGSYRGRHVCYGIREHGMAAAMNGMALHGGIIPYAGTFLGFSDTMRPALRQAALAGKRVIYLLAYDSVGSGDDVAAHQPAGHLASLRALPNLYVFRPADAMETAECWELALRRAEGPSLLVLTRQPVPALRTDAAENRCARGGYVLAEADGARQATLIASGSEVATALAAREELAREGIAAAVVSLPCWELFGQQDAVYRAGVLGGVPRMGIEAALGFGWERWLGDDGWFAGANGSDSAAPAPNFNGHIGITAEAVVAALKKRLDRGQA
jgi:transketolase